MDITDFIKWQAEDPENRSVKINIEPPRHVTYGRTNPVIWVYDYAKKHGQYVTRASEINLDALEEAAAREEFKKLAERFGGER